MGRNLKDETGNRYGRLTVLGLYTTEGYGGAVWSCHCDCGKDINVLGTRLRSGNTRSCGCLAKMTQEDREALGYLPGGKERVLREN